MRLRIDTTCFFWGLRFGIRDDWDCDHPDPKKVAAIDFHFYLTLPSFQPDYQHIRWVKKAYSMDTPRDKFNAEECGGNQTYNDYDENSDYDPIPF